MKKNYKHCKTRFLLFFLLSLFAGGLSPAWAQKALPYEYGFENYNLATEGWTTQSIASNTKITNLDKRTGSYSFYFYYNTKPPQYLISPELNVPSSATGVDVSFFYKAHKSNYEESFQVGYSTTDNSVSSFTWDDEVKTTSTTWTEYAASYPKDTKYVAIKYTANNKYYLYIDDVSITCQVSGPALSVYDGSNAISTGYNYGFGLSTVGTEKTFTLKNPGTEACPVSVSHTGDFGASLSANSIPAGGEVTLTVTMPEATGEDAITISSTAEGIDDFIINVSGTVKDPSKIWCDFTSGVPTGWTNSGNWNIATSGADGTTSGGGYAYNTSYGSNKLMYTPLVTIADGEKLYLQVKGYGSTASWNKLNIQYSADGTNWTNAKVLESITNEWQNLEVSEIPAGNWYIGFYGSYVYFTDFYGGTESTAPAISLSQANYDFGLIAENTTSESLTITNTGKSALTGLNITSNNVNFTVNCEATEIAANGGTATFTVTMAPNVTGAQTATITVKSDNADDLVFTATGAVAKEGTTTAVFNDATLAGWTKVGNTSFNSDETAAYFYYSTNTLASPKVNIAADDFLAVEAKMASSYGYVTVQGSVDGTSWTDIKKLDSSVLNQTDYTTAIVSGISTDYKYLRLNGYYCYVKQVAGLNYAAFLSVTQGTGAVTSPAAYAFGEVGTNQTVTYNFTNAGAGTIDITNVVSDNEVFTTNWTETVVADNYDLTITVNYDAAKAGEQNGTVTVTTTEGDFVINLTSTFLAADAPKFTLLIGETEQTTGADLGFGIITENTTKEFTIKNDGTGALNVTAITLPDEDYSIDATAPFEVAVGSSKTIKVTLAAASKTIKSSKNITISADGFEDFTFSADAYVLAGTEVIDFNTAIPSTWENESNGWSIYNNEAAKCTGKKNLTSPKLTFASDNDFFIFKVKASDSGSGDYVTIEGSSDNGVTWTAFDKKTYSYSGDFGANTGDYSTIIVSGIPSSVNKIRFNGYYVLIDEIAGLTYDANDPKMGIYTDADCTVTAAASVTKDFGFVTEDATYTYYIKNDGTGTLELDQDEVPAGFSAVLGKSQLASGESTMLTITLGQISGGYRSGNVVVNGSDDSSFTVAVSGVMIQEGKLNLNFATDNIPASWTNSNFTKNANGYIESPYGGGTLQTSTLTAEAGETIVIVAKQGYSSSSYTTAVNYRKVGEEEWSTLIAAQNLYNSTNWQMITATIAEAGDYELQFVGKYVHIQRIYGLSEPQIPFMAVYDGTTAAAATYNFGNVANDADATHTFTIKNEGNGTLVGVTATLSGDQADHYSVEISGLTDGNIAGKSEATLIVTQKKDNLGAHAATLTISSTDENIADIVIELSGVTRDASKMYVDFDTPNAFPEGWTVGTSWNVYTYGTDRYAYQSNTATASALVTTPLTVTEGETLTFQAARYNSYSAADLKARYTMDGGVTWSEYVDYASQITSGSFVTLELTDVPAGTAVVEFYGRYVKLDNISGFAPTTAPLFALATSETLTDGKYDFGQSLQEAPADKVFTITNSGNGNLVSTIAATGYVTAVLATTDGELSNGNQTVTLEPGETATITVSLIFDASEIGEKNGSVTIDSNEPVADVVLNFTANVIDPTAFNIDFANNTKPEGWYVSPNGYIFTDGVAKNSMSSIKDLITQKLRVAGEEDVLSYDAYVTASWAENYASLVVSYSTDRKSWTEVSEQPTLATTSNTFQIKGLAAGDYYLKFAGEYVAIDNISGWHIVTGIDHDLYVSDATFPTTTLIPETEDGVSASVTVNSLRADETGVYAKLFFDETEIATAEAQDIAKDGNKTFNLIGNVPATEKTYAAKIVVYYSDETVAWETATTEVEVAHTKTLDIKEFTRTDEGGDLTADENNQFSAAFSVKVQNTGTTEATPTVKIFIGETEVGSATATETVAVEGETTIAVNVTNASAGEGGELEFTAKAYWTAEGEALATSANNVTINVAAAAPKFALYEGEIAVENNTAVNFGLQTAAKTISYTIKNEGNKAMELVSIVAPEGFEATALTEGNKTIAVDGALNIDVTLKAEQGKVAGDLVITYKVDANTNNTFTLALSGRSISADTWTEDFESGIPANWTNENGWSIGITDGNRYATRTGWDPYSIMTPRLQAAKDEELTFDVLFVGSTFSYAYSTDKVHWSEEVVISATGEQTFTAPAAGNYYLRFTTRNGRLDNLIGFHLNPLDLILDETADNDFDTANYDNVTLNRAFIAGWNTVCLPFAIDNITAFFGDGAYAYKYTGYNEGDLTFTIVEDAMTAATPYLVFVPAAINSKELKNIAISGEEAGSVGDENATFTGTYDRIAAGGELAGKFVLTPDATIQKAGTSAWMNAFRAYFTIPTGLVKALVFDGGTATGVRRIELTGKEDVRDIFDLAGRKLNETRKGINIVNGKKVLVK